MKNLFIVLLTVLSLSAVAETAEQKLAALTSQIQAFEAKFTQTVMANGSAAKAQNSEGFFQLSRPGKFRWETLKPYKQLLVGSNKEMWIYESDIESATVHDLEEGLGSTPALLLASSAEQLTKTFKISEIATNHFKLLPKETSGQFDEVQLLFDAGQPKELLLADALGNKTRVVFSSVKTNDKIDDAVFVFKPGKNVDVIDNRRIAVKPMDVIDDAMKPRK